MTTMKGQSQWSKKALKEICVAVNGRAFKPSDWSEFGRPIIRIENLNNKGAPFNYFPKKVESRYEISKGDILISWSGTPGTSFGIFIWDREDAILNQHIFKIHLKDGVDQNYFFHAYNRILEKMIALYFSVKKKNQYDEFLHKVQQTKMNELWGNKEDEIWENA